MLESGWRMGGPVQLPGNVCWIMWEHGGDGWADFPVVISMYELIDSWPHTRFGAAASIALSTHSLLFKVQNSLEFLYYHLYIYFLPTIYLFKLSFWPRLFYTYLNLCRVRIFITFPPRLAKMTKGLLVQPRYSFSAHMSGRCQFSTVNVTRLCP